MAMNLSTGQRAQRKFLMTVAEWGTASGTTGLRNREILGARVQDSSIDLNADIETMTDILGKTYTDVNKTEPQQTLDPSFVIGGSKLSEYLYTAATENDISKYNGAFDVYIISGFIGDDLNGYQAVKHKDCSIIPTSIGGDAYVAMPIEVHFSNDIVKGTVDKLAADFAFSPAPAA